MKCFCQIFGQIIIKSVGCKIWDLENKSYYDFAGMGVTACSLGYSNRTINKALIKTFKNGSLTTLNSYEEYELAKIFSIFTSGLIWQNFANLEVKLVWLQLE